MRFHVCPSPQALASVRVGSNVQQIQLLRSHSPGNVSTSAFIKKFERLYPRGREEGRQGGLPPARSPPGALEPGTPSESPTWMMAAQAPEPSLLPFFPSSVQKLSQERQPGLPQHFFFSSRSHFTSHVLVSDYVLLKANNAAACIFTKVYLFI